MEYKLSTIKDIVYNAGVAAKWNLKFYASHPVFKANAKLFKDEWATVPSISNQL